ncbi:MAG: phosphoribosylamine--glycine ligase [Candidatus Aquicultorales bacterium]
MTILIIGGGGREHALAWKIAASPRVSRLLCVPGNGGMAEIAECVDQDVDDVEGIVELALARQVDLVVVGPEAPLVNGLVDAIEAAGIRAFGPSAAGARLEGSKRFAKAIMEKYGVPTGAAGCFTDYSQARAYLQDLDPPYVVKADGLAAGKGVIVTEEIAEADKALKRILVDRAFGAAGETVLVEEFLSGPELSLLAFTDGSAVLPMVPAQDYKRVYERDEGPNTGGMGSYSPVPVADEHLYGQVVEDVLKPTVAGLRSEGIDYKGVIYAGLVLTKRGPRVLEFNARFGDPETQAILPRLESDIVDVMLAVVEGRLGSARLDWSPKRCVTVVLASGGYPDKYETGKEISGLHAAESAGAVVFHAGTRKEKDRILTNGGRVLNVSALGDSFAEARSVVYEAISKISFDGMHFRKDIALRAVEQEESATARSAG